MPSALTPSATAAEGIGARDRRNRFFVGMSVLLMLIVLVGFARTFFLRPFFGTVDLLGTPELPVHLYWHGAALTAWFLLFFVQTCLVAIGRTDLHRRVGVAGAVVAVLVVVSGLWTVIRAVPRLTLAYAPLDAFGPLVFGNMAALVIFTVCVAVGIARRRQPAVHRRLMLLATISITAQAATRIGQLFGLAPLAFGVPTLLGLPLLLAAYDFWTLRRIHVATSLGILLVVLCFVSAVILMGSEAGRFIVEMLRGVG